VPDDPASRLIDELHQKLESTQAIERTVGAIFSVAWIVPGYWRTNTPMCGSTVAMVVAALIATSVTPRALTAEIRRREHAA
jgi:uncharacterized membrane protein